MKSHIGRWGNSLAFRIPKHIVEELDLKPNDGVECRVEAGELIVKPLQVLPELTLEELLSEVVEPEEEVDWGKPEGEEVW